MARVVLLVLAAGVGVGLYGRGADHTESDLLRWSAALGGPWLLVAFAVGALVAAGAPERRRHAAAAASAALVLGTLTYYGVFLVVERRVSVVYAAVVGVGWSAACVLVGASFGWAGAVWRERRGALATAALTGALAGEALLLRALWEQPAALRVLHLEVLAALCLAVALPRRRLATLALTVPFCLAVALAELFVRESLRSVGWAGA